MKKKLVVLTGAGISAESGLNTFRDQNGLWENYKIEEVATPEAWKANPGLVLRFYNQRRKDVLAAQPNKAHLFLAELEKDFEVQIITQNIDDLHERAGSSNILHLHGEILKMRSEKNEQVILNIQSDIQFGDVAPDGYQLRPHIVWFGEMVPNMELAADFMVEADFVVLIGSSLVVYPAAGLFTFAPREIPKFVLDPAIPIMSYENTVLIPKNATEGIEELRNKLMDSLKNK